MSGPTPDRPVVEAARLAAFCTSLLRAIGAEKETARDASRAMMHASLLGVDSHGVRLLPHYAAALAGGRLNPRPQLRFRRMRAGSGLLEANNAHGARATYFATDLACDLASEAGIGAVAIRNSSHFGSAGAYALAAVERGFCGLVFANSDSFVRLHGGAERFHGTNPIAFAVPSGSDRPWLLDMATSAVPYNRIQLYRATGTPLPEGVASDATGKDVTDPAAVEMLAPLGGAFGFKGAGLAGMAEIFAAMLTGMRLSHEILPMGGPDLATPREMGAFVIALDPDAFAGRAALQNGMQRYLHALRNGQAVSGATLLAPGDREWAEAERRQAEGIPLDPETSRALASLAREHGLPPLP